MNRLAPSIVLLIAIALFALSFRSTDSKLGPRISALLDNTSQQKFTVYIFFNNKGPDAYSMLTSPLSLVTQRSIDRRLKTKSKMLAVDYTDIPVYQPYADIVNGKVLSLRLQLKWFNAVSAEVTKEQLNEVTSLNFVRQVELVESFKRVREEQLDSGPIETPADYNPLADTLNYGTGNAVTQITQIKVNLVHNQGVFGQGILIASFDLGFRNQTHEVFTTLPTKILNQYDFQLHMPGAGNVGPSASHGTETLSNIGGYKPGKLIGPSFRSSFIVARTEVDTFERPIEMDNWVAAAQWADSLGADVISSSLGYLDFDIGYPSWTWNDMNGHTLVVTNGADIAADHGIVVCNSAGNNGNNSHNTLGAPADGDSVFTVGSVTSTGVRSSFSSVGPTTDNPPRIKPDIMAMGSNNYLATVGSTTAYTNGSGTSYSCPLTAGVVGLVLSSNKSLTNMQVMRIIKKFASNSASPNNLIGWGIIDASLSVDSARKLDNTAPVIQHTLPFASTINTGIITMKSRITDNGIIRNRTNEAPRLYYRKTTNGGINWTTYTAVNYSYFNNNDSFFFDISGSAIGTRVEYYIAAQDIALPSPLISTLPAGGSGINPPGTTPPPARFSYYVGVLGVEPVSNEIPGEFKLYNNYPNPFNPVTKIRFDIPAKVKGEMLNVKLVVYDITGKLTAVLINEELVSGKYEITFNASNLSSGVYFYKLKAGDFIEIKKMVVVK